MDSQKNENWLERQIRIANEQIQEWPEAERNRLVNEERSSRPNLNPHSDIKELSSPPRETPSVK